MSTIFDVRTLTTRGLSRTTVIVAVLVIALAVTAGVFGTRVYHRLTTTTVTVYFPETLALYPGDKVQVMGVQVGKIDSIEPDGGRSKVVLHFESSTKVPADATASILNPSLVASRTVQLSPPYTGGPALANDAVIPIERTRVPVEWDDLRAQLAKIITGLGPTPEQPRGPIGDVIDSFANGLAGKGEQLNTTFASLADALTALNKGRGDFFAVVRSLALFVTTLRASDRQFADFNTDLATLTGALDNSDQELATGVTKFRKLLEVTRSFLDRNGAIATKDVNNLAEVTNAILQPAPRAGLENALHVLPTFGANFANIYSATNGALTAVPVVNNFANPMQLLCSSLQAGSRMGYQESAELCAQYLAPILDAIKFNYLPFGVTPFTTASTLPKYVAYSEERLRPPPGFKDTTVPGVWARDTPFSRGNNEPGWIIAPGMQGLDLQPLTRNMLTPDSLAGLLGETAPAPQEPTPPAPGAAAPDAMPLLPAEGGGR